jgi:hypothetical protein
VLRELTHQDATNAMRLLAYGGTRFAERARVGRWPESVAGGGGDFEDTFDIPSGAGLLSYGVGVIDGSAVLILRERQNEHDRGGYPYTLLLDPGVEVWRQAGWNAARLALALRDDAQLWSDLLQNPERLSSEALLAERLRPRFNTVQHGSTPTTVQHGPLFNTVQHGSTRFDTDHGSTRFNTVQHGFADAFGAALAASLDAEPLYFPVASIGLTARPSFEEAAAALEALPAFVRVGGGWMMGGGKSGRAAFGCRVVFDDVSPAAEADAKASEAAARGRELLQQTRAVMKRLPASRVVAVLDSPAFSWEGGLESVVDALAAAARAAKGTADKATIDAIASFVAKGSAYSSEVLDGCTPEQQAAVWTALIERAADVDAVLAMVADAVLSLPASAPAIVAAGVQRTLALQGVLRSWTALQGQDALWPIVQQPVVAAARARVATDARWHIDYVLLGDDAGGAWLAKKHPGAIPDVVAALIAELDSGGHRDRAAAWLEALATSPARTRALLDEKLQVAQRLGGRWARLAALERACAGDVPVAFAAPAPADEEVRALVKELRELLDIRSRRTRSRPELDLTEIDRILNGRLTVEDLGATAAALGPLTRASTDWLAARGATTVARDAAVRSWLDGFGSGVPLSQLDGDGRRALVEGVFGGTGTPLDGERARAASLLKAAAAPDSRGLTDLIASTLSAASRDRRRALYVARLISTDAALAAGVLGWIEPDEAATLLQQAAEEDADVVAHAISIFWSDVTERLPDTAVGALHTLEAFLRRPSPAARAVRERVGRTMYGSGAGQFVAHVSEVRRSIEAAGPETSDFGAGRHGGFMSRLRKFFG